jgi:CRP/FNR family transcriptional regulator, cyclic AMP receptor protein
MAECSRAGSPVTHPHVTGHTVPVTHSRQGASVHSQTYRFDTFENCAACKWRQDGFFCQLDAAALNVLDKLAFTNVYPAGAALYFEGQPSRGAFLLCHGSAKSSISSGDGKTLINRIVPAGQVLGLSSSISGHPYRCTAETLEPAQVNFVRRDDFLRFLEQHSGAAMNAARQLAQDVEVDADHIRSLVLSHSAAEKLAHLILEWMAANGKDVDNGTRVQLLMTHEDISQLIGTSRETVTRLLKEFREKHILSIKGAALTVHDKAALEALVTS